MPYSSLEQALLDLEKHGHLVRVKEEVDPELEMAAIHLRVHAAGGPALLFEKVKGCRFRAASNIFGTKERVEFLFRDSIPKVQELVKFRSDPMEALRQPFRNIGTAFSALKAIPKKTSSLPVLANEIKVSDLPQIKHWPMDGGAFVTLPIVYTEDTDQPGWKNSNLGMYRVQLSGNDYVKDKEVGMHYQLHRGIGIHQTKANAKGRPMKVAVFVGGPPALTFGAVMPLPEGISELTFAGVLGGRKIRIGNRDGYTILGDCDFVITGEIHPGENKPEGPFGDHFGYYSLRHDFPVMRVHKVWHRNNAIWPFTVVGRPPQEDTLFGMLVHQLAGRALEDEIPGLHEVNAVDAAGVHPLLLAIGSERYTPYIKEKKPAEILTIANHILGKGQLSLAKYLFIASKQDSATLNTKDIPAFFKHVLERIDTTRDIHFQTKTSIDTLDYSGTGLNSGSKVVIAAVGDKKRELCSSLPVLELADGFSNATFVMPGIVAVKGPKHSGGENAAVEMKRLSEKMASQNDKLSGVMLITVSDDPSFDAASLNNWLWTTFTKSNPSHDISGVNEFTEHKHWGCNGPMIIDARSKAHHAPPLILDEAIEKRIERLFAKGGSLESIK